MAQKGQTSSASASTPSTAATQNLKSHACVLCQRRKVKCDRRDPCAGCTKARTKCEFRPPGPPRRRPRKSGEAGLLAKVRRYEELLRGYGVQIESLSSKVEVAREADDMEIVSDDNTCEQRKISGQDPIASKPSRSQVVDNGRMIMKNGKARYLENRLWTHLSDEFMEAGDILPVSSEDEDTETPLRDLNRMDPHGGDFLLDSPASIDLRSLHPSPIQSLRLWQTFLDNVNPLVKLVHAPTVQQALLEATEDLDDVPRPMECLMFAIYACAVLSMSNAECEKILGEARSDALPRYQNATRQALIGTGLLKTSNITLLQSFVLFLLCMRQRYDSQSLWVLTGVATRIGVRLGLHRDGADLNIAPFEAEIRRRLWWQIILLEARAAEFSGVGHLLSELHFTTKIPLNINDGSLHPSMVEFPVEENGATEMIHCLIRYEIGNFLKQGHAMNTLDGSLQRLNSSEVSVEHKEKAIQGLEELLERRYLRYCDPSIPLHFVSAIMNIPQEEKEILFSICVKIIEYDNIVQNNSATQGFLWHTREQFQWDALIHVLSELRSREAGESTNHAWHQVDEVFKHHSFIDKRKGLHVAIIRLTARAWESYESRCGQNQQVKYEVVSEQLLEVLRARKAILRTAADAAKVDPKATEADQLGPVSSEGMIDSVGAEPDFDFNTWPLDSSDMDWRDWSRWDDLLQDSELNPVSTAF
ncbi:MAG: hypothetical protein Q9191_000678 [Dirinaria sp. TL-2023a]